MFLRYFFMNKSTVLAIMAKFDFNGTHNEDYEDVLSIEIVRYPIQSDCKIHLNFFF